MNEFSVNRKNVQREKMHKNRKHSWTVSMLFVTFLIISCIFGTFVMRVCLMDKIEKLSAEGYKIQSKITQKELEIQSLKNQKAHLCSWENVSRKIDEYHLALQKQNPEQIRYMNRYDFDRIGMMNFETALTMEDGACENAEPDSVNTGVASLESLNKYMN